MSQQSVNKYENHSVEPDLNIVIVIADYFITSVDYLIGHTDVNRKIENTSEYELNSEELCLIKSYRQLNDKERLSIDMVIDNYMHKV